ncbi:MAG: thioester domain-containing protein [Clostridia bacterium]|nr:thioester domain-containing protein [Clostridia bacterium]
MLKEKKILKKVIAMLLIITILLPYSTNVFAVALTHSDTEVKLETINHEGGDDESEFVTDLIDNYDTNPYTYKVSNSEESGKTTVFKIRKEGDNDFEDALYCLNAEKAFPSNEAKNYTNVGNLKNSTSVATRSLINNIGNNNYKSLIWLIDNMYLRKQQPKEKEQFIRKAFATQIDSNVIPPLTAEYIASVLTDDDIEVVQQWAIWYFTNANNDGYSSDYERYYNAKYSALGTISVSGLSTHGDDRTFLQISESNGAARQEFAEILFDYLVMSALNSRDDEEVTYPSFAMQNSDLSCTVDGNYYKVGPFKVNSGTKEATIKLVDGNGQEISEDAYSILKEGETSFTSEKINQIFNKNYFIYIPMEGNTITTVKVKIEYTTTETNASLWLPDEDRMQPVVLITRQKIPHNEERGKNIETKIFDLALRKYIVKIGNIELTNRTPNVDPSKISTDGTATYKHVKTPITVEPGTNVVFELRVYNEGTLDGTATEITDYLPEGMILATNSTINSKYGWVASSDGRNVTTTYLSSHNIEAYSRSGNLSSDYVQIECTISENIADNITSRLTLTNVAEITKYSRNDFDSSKSIDPSTINSNWRGDSSNSTDLTKTDYYYKGLQDDDDFEKISIDPIVKKLDLALRKYIITKVNYINAEGSTRRIPVVDPSTIAENGTATYKHPKDPVVVEPGNRVVFEIRVYNEGTKAGTATEITDYLPKGLKLTENSSINEIYKWTASEDGRVVTTDYLKNSTIEAYTGTGNLNSLYVQIECTVDENIKNGLTANKTLTNVAEITGYSDEDRDSSKTIDPTTITDSYSGNTSNKSDLSDSSYYYIGLEDDDDFEKLVIEVKSFDLALKKFITKINGVAPKTSRTPVVDVSKLKEGKNDATYTMPKKELEVKKGDIVTYTIRVYNEGEVDGYAEEVADYLPAGLGYLLNYKGNVSNKWAIPSNGTTTKKLSELENGTANLKAEDFEGTTALADQIVVIGGGKFTSTKLASSDTSTENLIPAFNGTKLEYKDIEITCIVLSEDTSNNNLRNIAEVMKNTDESKEIVVDRDSKPGTVDPSKYPDGEKEANDGKTQDDHDYESLTTPTAKYFDLALQKFITKLNNDAITNRVPTITKNQDGTFRYNHTTEALPVANNDEITYTIRVYNEGLIDGYAKEVMDDIPTGLVFLPDNSTNKTYEWKMYNKEGKETTDVNQAVTVKTTYLSKEKETESRQNLIKAYDDETMKTPAYKDVLIVFKVSESALTDKTKRDIVNTAEITSNQDSNGNNITDKDSTPGNKKDGEDDLDKEKVKVKYFDLALKKTLAKIIITENGKTREIVPANEKDLLKVEINRKRLSTTTVKFVYNITITNEGQIAGYAKEIKDYIPKGLVFNQNDNPNWTPVSTDVIRTEALANTLIEPGKSATVSVTLEWNKDENNLGEKINTAEISKNYNDSNSPDIDSTPDNKKEGEDDIDTAPVILSIATGEEPVYVVLSTAVLTILSIGILLIKKYVLI